MLALIPLSMSLERIKFRYILDKDKPENGISNLLLMDDLKLFCQELEPDLWNDDIYCKKVGMVFWASKTGVLTVKRSKRVASSGIELPTG